MSVSQYTHSEIFARLKGTKEVIAGNPTSYQWLQSLDTFIYYALYSIIDNTTYVDVFLGKVLAWQSTNPKRKGSNVGKQALLNYIVLFFLCDNTKKKVKILREMRLDRGILAELLRQWLKITERYEQLANQASLSDSDRVEMAELQVKSCLRQGHSLYGASIQTRFWFARSREFKELIFQKFTRMVLNAAQRDYVELGHRVELDDIIIVYMMTASKAIDKCDTDKGVLTSHIENWLKSAKNVVASHTNGSTSFVPNQVKTEIEKAATETGQFVPMPIESLEHMAAPDTEEATEAEESLTRIRTIARIFDPSGYGRLSLGIQEQLAPKERYRLRSLMVGSRSKLDRDLVKC